MLHHRTNVLLTTEEYNLLTKLAHQYKTSKSVLIRQAIQKVYANQSHQQSWQDQIKSGWKWLDSPSKPLQYKQLVENGRQK